MNMKITFQLNVRSIWPATYDASPESLAYIHCINVKQWLCEKEHPLASKRYNELLTSSIFPRSKPSKFFNVKPGGKTNLNKTTDQYICLDVMMMSSMLEPVLDIRFTASQSWGVDSECNGLETSLFSSPHKLSHDVPVLVHLVHKQWFS